MAIRTQPSRDIDAEAEAARVAAALEEMRAAFAAIDRLGDDDHALLARLGDHGAAAVPTLAADTGLTATAAKTAVAVLSGLGLAVVAEPGERGKRPSISNLGRTVLAEIRRRTGAAATPELARDLAIAADAVARLRQQLKTAA